MNDNDLPKCINRNVSSHNYPVHNTQIYKINTFENLNCLMNHFNFGNCKINDQFAFAKYSYLTSSKGRCDLEATRSIQFQG
jgi:hypothetical protein